MSLKSILSPQYFIPLSELLWTKFPDELMLSNPNIYVSEEYKSITNEMIAYHGLSSKELISKLKSTEYGGDLDKNELNAYRDGTNTLNYDKSIISDSILMFLGAFITLSIILIYNNFNSIFSKIRKYKR